MSIYINIYGGLGNQLFQLFYSKCLFKLNNKDCLYLCSGLEATFETKRDFYLDNFLSSEILLKKLSPIEKLRPVKVLSQLNLANGRIDFLGSSFLDGYFQTKNRYTIFNSDILKNEISFINHSLNINRIEDSNNKTLCHIRLTDFFKNNNDRIQFIQNLNLDQYDNFITDDEDLLAEFIDLNKIIPSKNLSPLGVLKEMSSYKKVVSNGSSLAFWGAVLGGGKLETTVKKHQDLFDYLNLSLCE